MAMPPASYLCQTGAMLRATTYTGPDTPGLTRELDLLTDTGLARALAWLSKLWQQQEVRTALLTASPALAEQVTSVLTSAPADPRRSRRTVLSVVSYLLRWAGRPTPFGLFAGTAPLKVGAAPKVTWGSVNQVSVRADAEWISDIIARLEQCPALLDRLPVVTNNTSHLRGTWWAAPGRPADGHTALMAPLEVSVGHTRPVAAALRAAHTPIRYGALRAVLADQFTHATTQQIDTVLAGLLEQGMLISSLWAPMTTVDAFGHLCAELDAAHAHTIPEISELVQQLRDIRQALTRPDHPLPGHPQADLSDRMLTISDVAPMPLALDTALNCDVQIPRYVVREAERAVTTLNRLTSHPFGYQHWRDYHRRFRARYGVGAAVPVLDLVADSGLGLPADYLGSARRRSPRQLTERDEHLLALLQQTFMEGHDEIVLTDRIVASLENGAEDRLPTPRVEIAFEIHARSQDALAQGDFTLAVTGTPRPGSSMAGRFAHLLPPDEQASLTAAYAPSSPGASAAQLSFAPRRRRNDNIARTAQLLPNVISLGEHHKPQQGHLPPTDLAVTADARRLHLVQISTGTRIEPRQLNALEAASHTPPLVRFLAEISTARCAAYTSFDFGAARKLPYLPRVRYRRTILAPARWLLHARDLPGRSATTQQWEDALTAWRARLRVPQRVAIVEHEQRLPLDLSVPVHRLLLRQRIESAGRLELREVAHPADLAWIGRAHEVLLSMTTKSPSPVVLPSTRPAGSAHLPGQATILHAQLFGHPVRYDELLTGHLASLLAAFDTPPACWFHRHRVLARPDDDQYLALYLHLPNSQAYGSTAERLHNWAAELRNRHLLSHLTLATYEPQEGRYGHGPAMDAAHALFAADSAAALAQLRLSAGSGTDPRALAAASMTDLVTCFFPTPDEGLRWLVHHLERGNGPLDRTLRDAAFALTDQPAQTDGAGLSLAWKNRAVALAAYRSRLAEQRDPASVVRSLLHLHQVRAVGVDPEAEQVTTRLARACALRRTARTRTAT